VRAFGDTAALRDEERQQLRRLLESTDAGSVRKSLSEVNERVAVRSTTISRQCVVGNLHPTGRGGVEPYGIDDQTEYMPPFVWDSLVRHGVTALELRPDAQGKPLPPYWVSASLTVQNGFVVFIYAIRNVASIVGGGDNTTGASVWWKVAGENEQPPVIEARPSE
jgi:hypothetical protein